MPHLREVYEQHIIIATLKLISIYVIYLMVDMTMLL